MTTCLPSPGPLQPRRRSPQRHSCSNGPLRLLGCAALHVSIQKLCSGWGCLPKRAWLRAYAHAEPCEVPQLDPEAWTPCWPL